MREPSDETQGRRPRIGSLFSGYGGVDLAVEEVFDGETVWPGTRSGLWARMAEAIDVLQPEWVVAENVRGLLSAIATRPTPEGDDTDGRNPIPATPEPATLDGTVRGVEPDPWHLGDQPARPLRALGAGMSTSGLC